MQSTTPTTSKFAEYKRLVTAYAAKNPTACYFTILEWIARQPWYGELSPKAMDRLEIVLQDLRPDCSPMCPDEGCPYEEAE